MSEWKRTEAAAIFRAHRSRSRLSVGRPAGECGHRDETQKPPPGPSAADEDAVEKVISVKKEFRKRGRNERGPNGTERVGRRDFWRKNASIKNGNSGFFRLRSEAKNRQITFQFRVGNNLGTRDSTQTNNQVICISLLALSCPETQKLC